MTKQRRGGCSKKLWCAQTPVQTSSGPVPITMSFELLLSQEWSGFPWKSFFSKPIRLSTPPKRGTQLR